MEIIFRNGESTAADVRVGMTDPPSYSSVRALLRILEEKGHLHHREEGNRYVFLPVQARHAAAKSALRQVVQTFFGGSVEAAVTTLLSAKEARLSPDEIDRLSTLIEQARVEKGADAQ